METSSFSNLSDFGTRSARITRAIRRSSFLNSSMPTSGFTPGDSGGEGGDAGAAGSLPLNPAITSSSIFEKMIPAGPRGCPSFRSAVPALVQPSAVGEPEQLSMLQIDADANGKKGGGSKQEQHTRRARGR